MNADLRRNMVSLAAGVLFGAGLAVAQMTNPAKIRGFLDVAGAWDPSLAFVMAAALAVATVAFRIRAARGAPKTPQARPDARLIGGSALFGVGWGLAGFCPGPAVAALVTGSGQVALFVVSMVAGMVLYHFVAEGDLRKSAEENVA